jgi:hypothetical protein
MSYEELESRLRDEQKQYEESVNAFSVGWRGVICD